jgi:hypothetical protein
VERACLDVPQPLPFGFHGGCVAQFRCASIAATSRPTRP